jgi:ABC-2 type transport system permease protein
VRLFFEIARRSFARHLTYRAAAVAGLATNFFFGLLRAAVLLALFGEAQEVAGYTQRDAVTYTGLTQAVIAYLGIFGWYDLMRAVHSGEVAADLLRPLNLFTLWLAHDLGRALAALLLRGLGIMLLYALVFDLSAPVGPLAWLALLVAVALSWLVSFAFRFLVNLAAFWTPNALGIGRFFFYLGLFLSGFLMPLDLFPDWLQRAAAVTPFPYMLDTVVGIYLGVTGPSELLGALLLQLAWVLGMMVAAQLLLRSAVRRLVVLGG